MRQARLSIELRTNSGSIGMQSLVDFREETIRVVRKELKPNERIRLNLDNADPRSVAFLVINARFPCSMLIGGETISLGGSVAGDFGLLYCRRGDESMGVTPWPDGLSTIDAIEVVNDDTRLNRVEILFADGDPVPAEPVEPDDATASDDVSASETDTVPDIA